METKNIKQKSGDLFMARIEYRKNRESEEWFKIFAIKGDRGEKGEKGDRGEVGAALNIRDVLTDESQLPYDGQVGDAYFINGILYIYHPTSIPKPWKSTGGSMTINMDFGTF